jgi:hypothetical protein
VVGFRLASLHAMRGIKSTNASSRGTSMFLNVLYLEFFFLIFFFVDASTGTLLHYLVRHIMRYSDKYYIRAFKSDYLFFLFLASNQRQMAGLTVIKKILLKSLKPRAVSLIFLYAGVFAGVEHLLEASRMEPALMQVRALLCKNHVYIKCVLLSLMI